MSAAALAPSERRAREAAWQARVTAEATRFDLRSLLRLLAAHGYERHDIAFESSPDDVSGSSLIAGVAFEPPPRRRVLITLHLGLLGTNGLLPSYFAQTIEAAPDPEPYYEFIHFFDRVLLERFVRSVFPEDDQALFSDYGRTKRQYVHMLGLHSVSTLHWLCALYFPELEVRVTRRPFQHATDAHAFRTGISHLDGTGIIGRRYESTDEGFCVELFSQEEYHDNGQAWPHLVRKRLHERLFPVLHPARIPLTVILAVLSHATWVRIQREGYLGYERFRTPEESGHRIVIHSGYAS